MKKVINKNWLCVLVIAFLSLNSYCQYSATNRQIISKRVTVTKAQNDLDYIYRKDIDNDLDKFEGTWRFTDIANNLVFTLKIEKMEDVSLNDPNTTRGFLWSDDLHGYFKLEINGNVIVDNIPIFTPHENRTNLESITFTSDNFDSMWVVWDDPSKGISNIDAGLRYFQSNNQEYIEFIIARRNGTSTLDYPTTMILEKI